MTHGRQPGLKVSGGIRSVEKALLYLEPAERELPSPLTPALFRIGASALVADVVERRRRH